MQIRLTIPIAIYSLSPTAEDPQLTGHFEHGAVRVTYALTGVTPPFPLPPDDPPQQYVKIIDSMLVELEDGPGTSQIADLVAAAQWMDLLD